MYLYFIFFFPLIFLFYNIFFFFFNDTATTEIYTLSLHDALPISVSKPGGDELRGCCGECAPQDRKSTRLNSSHSQISYAVFCLKKKKKKNKYKNHNKKKKKKYKKKQIKLHKNKNIND